MAVAPLPAGTVVHLIASDPAALLDLQAWCHLTGHSYLGPVAASFGSPPPRDGTPAYALRATGQPQATEPSSPWRLQA